MKQRRPLGASDERAKDGDANIWLCERGKLSEGARYIEGRFFFCLKSHQVEHSIYAINGISSEFQRHG